MFSLRHWTNYHPPPARPSCVFCYRIQSNRRQTCHVADHDAGAGGSWMGGRGQTWREGQHGGQPILCKPTPICRPALYASSVHHGATSPFQTLPNILFKRRLLTNGVQSIKGWTLCHRDRKMSTKSSNRQKISNKQGSANIGSPYCLYYKTNVLPVHCDYHKGRIPIIKMEI